MKSILFVMKYPLHRRHNLKAKFDGQMAAMKALGYEVYGIGWDEQGMWLLGSDGKALLRENLWAKLPGYDHTLIFVDLMAAVKEVLKRRKIDLLYLRYMPTFGNAVGAMRAVKDQGGKLVLEYPTYPKAPENNRTWWRRLVFAYTDRVLNRINPMVDLYTAIGEPCGGSIDGRPAMNISNGVDGTRFRLHRPNADDPVIHLLAPASMSAWHGYDRIIHSLAAYRGTAQVRLHMVGGDGDGSLAAWKQLAQDCGLQEQVVFHGPMYGEALEALVARCDVGVSSLGMYRWLSRAMPLKSREFMARGLPFLYAVDDPSIPDDPRFCLQFENDDSPIDMEVVVAFAQRSKNDRDVGVDMQEYARQHLSWESTMHSVLERVQHGA